MLLVVNTERKFPFQSLILISSIFYFLYVSGEKLLHQQMFRAERFCVYVSFSAGSVQYYYIPVQDFLCKPNIVYGSH